MFKLSDHHAAFPVVFHNANIIDNLQRRLPGQQRDAGIALALGAVGINMVAFDTLQSLVDLIGLGLGFLQQNTVGIQQCKCFGKALALYDAGGIRRTLVH